MNTPAVLPNPPRTLNIVVGLVRDYLGLEPDQVVVYNQKWRIPSDQRLYVTIGLLAQKPYGSTLEHLPFTDESGEGLKEVVTLNSQESLSVNVYSRGQLAIERKDEVIMAFGSTAAQQLCEQHSIKLGRLPLAMTDVSGLDGVAILNRFVATINLLCARRQERVVQYFNRFQVTGIIINP